MDVTRAALFSLTCLAVSTPLAGFFTGCRPSDGGRYAGYVSGEYVLVASPAAGRLERLPVERGAWVEEGAELFVLDPQPERDQMDAAAAALRQAEANLADLQKGKRPTEIAAIEHQQKAALAAQTYTDIQLKRSKELYTTKVVAEQNLNLYQSADIALMEIAASLESSLESAGLGGRVDQVAAAKAQVDIASAQLAQARWNLAQKTRCSPSKALVFDTMFRPGEWIPAGQAVVSLLPPERVRVRFFVPETTLASLKTGEEVTVTADGASPARGRISYISPSAEYSPPVIFSRESRAQLVFLVEVSFDPKTAAALHPGLPVTVSRGKL
ncbi:MAG: HlyD family efflux transporter periplasmic adaptor subunit [Verrucomicrobia bacterium]|nr:HlyD family efflux transporter periplasmic adaptor subunit [Verrucomicrobiota bacterium]